MADELALLGGIPVREVPLPTYNTIGDAERAAVLRVLDTGELSGFVAGGGDAFWGGTEVRALETAFADRFGRPAIALNSATSGLHSALAAFGCGPGDEVVVPPLTMTATATTVLQTGAVPVFADVEPSSLCLDPQQVEAAISPYTKAIVAVNLLGHPADLTRLRSIADDHGLFLLEDNAQAPGATHAGKPTGTIGDAGVFSFNRHKTIQSGEGGVVVCRDDDLALRVALVRNHGEYAVENLGVSDIVNTVGWNYRMTEMEAAVARVQFLRLDELNEARMRLAGRLTEGLAEIEGIAPPPVEPGSTHVYYMYGMRYNESQVGLGRDLFVEAVNAEGFPLRGGYVRPVYLEPVFQQRLCFGRNGFPFTASPRGDELDYRRGVCPVAERIHEEELVVAGFLHPQVTHSDVDALVYAMAKVIRHRDRLLAADRT